MKKVYNPRYRLACIFKQYPLEDRRRMIKTELDQIACIHWQLIQTFISSEIWPRQKYDRICVTSRCNGYPRQQQKKNLLRYGKEGFTGMYTMCDILQFSTLFNVNSTEPYCTQEWPKPHWVLTCLSAIELKTGFTQRFSTFYNLNTKTVVIVFDLKDLGWEIF